MFVELLPSVCFVTEKNARVRIGYGRVGERFGGHRMKFQYLLGLACALAVSLGLTVRASAEDKVVKIGAVIPMTGEAAAAGRHAKYALEVATDIVNTAHPELGDLVLAKNAGLAGLSGAKVEVVFADTHGSPATGQSQAQRLITEEKVAALIGAYQSGVTLGASAIAEAYGVPFLTPESVAANLTERGFKWFFRTTPVATDFARLYNDFLDDVKASGTRTDVVVLVHDNTEYGISAAGTIAGAFREKGRTVTDAPYGVNATDVQSQVLQLKEKKPDVVLMISSAPDAILFAKTMQALDYRPPLLLADDAGYSDPFFIKTVGKISLGAFNRSAWSVGPAGSPTAIIADLYRKKSGEEMDDTAGREMQGFFVLVDAIDRAGSTDPAKIQAALRATDLKPNQLMMGYKGVKFDEKGRNVLASGVIIQLQDGENYVAVYPKSDAAKAPILPYKGW